MFRSYATCVLLGAAFLATMPAAVVAETDLPTPEGTTWYLVSYETDGQFTQVPWYVDATLVLDDGRAFGSTGCRSLSGSYALNGDALTFDRIGADTDLGCGDAWMGVEAGYMAALPSTATWARDTGLFGVALNLYDEPGAIIATFQESAATLTQADVFMLASELDALRKRIRKLEQVAPRD